MIRVTIFHCRTLASSLSRHHRLCSVNTSSPCPTTVGLCRLFYTESGPLCQTVGRSNLILGTGPRLPRLSRGRAPLPRPLLQRREGRQGWLCLGKCRAYRERGKSLLGYFSEECVLAQFWCFVFFAGECSGIPSMVSCLW